MVTIMPEETYLQGYWLDTGSSMTPDSNWERINDLTANHLELLASSKDGREQLYRDNTDGRLWELAPVEPMLPAGPPRLRVISNIAAEEKYGLKKV